MSKRFTKAKATFNTAYICYFFDSNGGASGRPSNAYEDTLLRAGSQWVKCFVLSRMTRIYIKGFIRTQSGLWQSYNGSKEWNEDLIAKSANLSKVRTNKRESYFLVYIFSNGKAEVSIGSKFKYKDLSEIPSLIEVAVISTYNGYHVYHYIDNTYAGFKQKHNKLYGRAFVKLSKIERETAGRLRARMGTISNRLLEIANLCSETERSANFFPETIEAFKSIVVGQITIKPIINKTTVLIKKNEDKIDSLAF